MGGLARLARRVQDKVLLASDQSEDLRKIHPSQRVDAVMFRWIDRTFSVEVPHGEFSMARISCGLIRPAGSTHNWIPWKRRDANRADHLQSRSTHWPGLCCTGKPVSPQRSGLLSWHCPELAGAVRLAGLLQDLLPQETLDGAAIRIHVATGRQNCAIEQLVADGRQEMVVAEQD